jgi:hypothetical protein
MSSELRRQGAIAAIGNVAGGNVFASPVERRSTGQTLLLVIMVDEGHQVWRSPPCLGRCLCPAITEDASAPPHGVRLSPTGRSRNEVGNDLGRRRGAEPGSMVRACPCVWQTCAEASRDVGGCAR